MKVVHDLKKDKTMNLLIRFGWMGLLVSMAFCGEVFAQGPRDENAAKKFGWLSNYQEGLATAKKTGKPMMLVFRCIP